MKRISVEAYRIPPGPARSLLSSTVGTRNPGIRVPPWSASTTNLSAGDLGNHTSSVAVALLPSSLATSGNPGEPSNSAPEKPSLRQSSEAKWMTASSPLWQVARAVTSTRRISWVRPYTHTGYTVGCPVSAAKLTRADVCRKGTAK